MPIAIPTPACKGYVLASPTTEGQQDPYAIVPCPNTPSRPATLSTGCAHSKRSRACGREVWCAQHHCGGCKKASRDAGGYSKKRSNTEGADLGLDKIAAKEVGQ